MKLLAAVVSGLVVIVAAVAYFALSPEILPRVRVYSAPWIFQTIDSNGGGGTSIAIDSYGNVHVGYSGSGGLMYATNVGGSWAISTVANVVADYISLALDSNDSAHISYLANDKYLGYATNSGGSWTNYSIDNGGGSYIYGYFTSVELDSKDKVHISYQRLFYHDSLKYATNANGSWMTYTITEYGDYTGTSTSLAVDSNDNVHISYLCRWYDGWKLCCYNNTYGSWTNSVVAGTWSSYYEFASTSIAMDSNDKVHICWNYGRGLGYSTNANGSWVTSIIDSPNDIRSDGFTAISLALDSNDRVHVGYYDLWNHTLKYATNVSGIWEYFTIDRPCWYGSIALDSDDEVHVSYGGSSGLTYATNSEPIIVPEFEPADLAVVLIVTVSIFVALRRTSFPSTKG